MRTIASLVTIALLVMAPPAALAGSEDSDSKTEEVAAGYLGIHLQRIEGGLAEALDLDEDAGVLIRQVVADSPAEKAGLLAGDIVTRFDGEDVGAPSGLRKLVRQRHAGDEVEIRVLRDGKDHEVRVELAAADELSTDVRRVARKVRDKLGRKAHQVRELRFHGERGFLGVSTQELTGGLGEYFGVEKNHGALVSEVVEDSPAEELGLRPGDVIVKVGDEDIDDPATLATVVGAYEEAETVEVRWVRDRKEKSGQVELEIRESGPTHWFDGSDLALPGLGHLGLFDRDGDGVKRHVEIHRFDEDTADALEELREELDDLRDEVEALRQKVE
jgi:serine protease Do